MADEQTAFERAVEAAMMRRGAFPYIGRDLAKQIVRAVLLAIREPDEGMRDAASWTGGISDNGGNERGSFDDEWSEAITHLLSEG